jgi:hypothetical protein
MQSREQYSELGLGDGGSGVDSEFILDWYISSWCGFAVVVLPDSEKC